jgi:hypothetical protein
MSSRNIISGELQAQILAELRRRCNRRGTAKRVAFEAGCSVNHVWGVLAGREKPGPLLAVGLGLVRIEPVAPAAAAAPSEGVSEWLKDQLTLELVAE